MSKNRYGMYIKPSLSPPFRATPRMSALRSIRVWCKRHSRPVLMRGIVPPVAGKIIMVYRCPECDNIIVVEEL